MSTKEVVKVGENVSAILQRKLPPKCKDPGSFTIPCVIGNTRFESAMLDLGASINVMPYSIYASMNLGALKNDGVIIQLADRSNAYPKGVLEDVLVQVNHLVFPADFYVLEMDESDHAPSLPILLGRPFMKTARTKIDVYSGTLSMEFDGEVVNFNLSDSIKYPSEDHSCFSIDIIDSLAQGYLDDLNDDALEKVITRGMEITTKGADCMHAHGIHESSYAVPPSEELLEVVVALEFSPKLDGKYTTRESIPISTNKLLPSIIQAPILELKPLPSHLKYIFLGENETLPAIISSSLTAQEEEKLLRVLKEFKSALGWTLADIKGISPMTCMHHIFLEEGAKPTREAQRRLNPPMMEVVKKEIIKLLDCGVIYPISDSKWVSPVQCVPKKSGVTVVANAENELVPQRIQTGWRVCIDYRKLNTTTRKDHFPLLFIDQMLERLAGYAFYCFLDGYSGYNQIVISPEDQEKTTFTCPFGTFAYRRMPFGLCNAPATFQRCMMSIFSDYVEKIIEVFMDDFSVFGDSFDSCLHNLSLILKRCVETNLVLNWEKCHFMVKQGIVLGHIISEKGIEVDKSKIDLVRHLPSPTSVREVRSFLGHAGFYRRFIKDFSKIAQPLCRLLQKEVAFAFTKECTASFNQLKELLTTAPIIVPPDWSLPFELMCDASDYALGAVLGQRKDKRPHVIYYASRTLNDAQLNYSTTEKELLAVVFALDKFRSYLIGTKVIVFTDHAALKYLLTKKEAKPRLIRWILLLQEFDIEIRDKKGSENVVADHLSRMVHNEDSLPILETFPDEQLLSIKVSAPWYADIVNFLVSKRIPSEFTRHQRDKLRHDARFYVWDDPYLWKFCPDQIVRRCVHDSECHSILSFCHTYACMPKGPQCKVSLHLVRLMGKDIKPINVHKEIGVIIQLLCGGNLNKLNTKDIGSHMRSSIQDLCTMVNQTQGSQNQAKEAQQDAYWQPYEEFYTTPLQPPPPPPQQIQSNSSMPMSYDEILDVLTSLTQGSQQEECSQPSEEFYQWPYVPPQSSQTNSGTSMDNDQIVQLLTSLTHEGENQANKMDELEKHVGQIVEFMAQIQEQSEFSNANIVSSMEDFEITKAITLGSAMEVGAEPRASKQSQEEDEHLLIEEEEEDTPTARVEQPLPQPPRVPMPSNSGKLVTNSILSFPIPPNVPFPRRFFIPKEEESEKDIVEALPKVQSDIPILGTPKQVPDCVEIPEENCTPRRRIQEKKVAGE
ncbi:uncharacterized protein [Malus domestica]|uniref:uncharacterized protein n=1 Tax=Malus domestica TaxID=3750 RepID=UPI00397589AC